MGPAGGDETGFRCSAKERTSTYPSSSGRALFYLAVWAVLAHLLSKWSRQLDEGTSLRIERRLRGLHAGGGLLLMGLTITFRPWTGECP